MTVPDVSLVDQRPVSVTDLDGSVVLLDFGRVAFGNLAVNLPNHGALTFHLGEALRNGRIDRLVPGTPLASPPACVRYTAVTLSADHNAQVTIIAPSPDKRNTGNEAIRTPEDWGVVIPFRWVEIEGWIGDASTLGTCVVRRSAFLTTWRDDAADFQCSDQRLADIWQLCRYSIKATTFAGIYVDGDRERIPYEGDAYVNQLSHYYCDSDTGIARRSFDHLLAAPTWPTEFSFCLILMAEADWMQTGDAAWLSSRYEALKNKLLSDRVRPDGLVSSTLEQMKLDIVDWPSDERDDFQFSSVNAVVNAFYYRALVAMAKLAEALRREADAAAYWERAVAVHAAFQRTFFDVKRRLYRDGDGEHASLHTNFFALAFGLVTLGVQESVVDYCVGRGMACSVYTAQYLLDALFENGAEQAALDLITAPGDRSWAHMLASGTTITWEAWDQRYKPNQDWNHAWGSAPANLLPRHVAGVRALRPGWEEAAIAPRTGTLQWCRCRVPTPHGPVEVDWRQGSVFNLKVSAPESIGLRLSLPAQPNPIVHVDGQRCSFWTESDRIIVDGIWRGARHITLTSAA